MKSIADGVTVGYRKWIDNINKLKKKRKQLKEKATQHQRINTKEHSLTAVGKKMTPE